MSRFGKKKIKLAEGRIGIRRPGEKPSEAMNRLIHGEDETDEVARRMGVPVSLLRRLNR